MIAPAIKAALPCVPHPARTIESAEHLNRQNQIAFLFPRRRGLRSPRPADFLQGIRYQRTDGRESEHSRLSCIFPRAWLGKEGWIKGGGGFVKSPLLCRLLFVLFLPIKKRTSSPSSSLLPKISIPFSIFSIEFHNAFRYNRENKIKEAHHGTSQSPSDQPQERS